MRLMADLLELTRALSGMQLKPQRSLNGYCKRRDDEAASFDTLHCTS